MKQIILFVLLVVLSFIAVNLLTHQNKHHALDGCVGNRNTLLCIHQNEENAHIEKVKQIYKKVIVKQSVNEKEAQQSVETIHQPELLITKPDILETLQIQPAQPTNTHTQHHEEVADSQPNSNQVPQIQQNEHSSQGIIVNEQQNNQQDNGQVTEQLIETDGSQRSMDLQEVSNTHQQSNEEQAHQQGQRGTNQEGEEVNQQNNEEEQQQTSKKGNEEEIIEEIANSIDQVEQMAIEKDQGETHEQNQQENLNVNEPNIDSAEKQEIQLGSEENIQNTEPIIPEDGSVLRQEIEMENKKQIEQSVEQKEQQQNQQKHQPIESNEDQNDNTEQI